jgi:transcriptional regulator with XRE-family HTH domain
MIDSRPYQLVLTRLVEDGATDADIAERIGYSRTAVRNIRTGRTAFLHPETAHAIAALLERVRT